ncbi:hypothetical protein MJ257_19750 [Paenibacillus timonensis]|uniref:AlgX/AlgJ SGNH hydrolase-like domain-containing protein n=1 Tax=Paenibacillus timonensis TaxID=225915 RepID=A0ABW3SG32_9BACL|nr:hypothetical protein [Paenibacillus timonensis]MCH1642339.1 hypothetical protein [Paenibacillus timonensis]
MKAHKVYNVLLVVLFIVAITVPLIAVNKIQGKISVAENRALTKFPHFTSGEGHFNTQFVKEFESWFNDNFGYRDQLVKVNTEMQYNLFGKITKSDTIEGKNKWLYYVTPDIIADYQQINLPSDQQLREWGNGVDRIDNYLKSKNIPFIMMLNPDKKTIYSENYPDTILKVGDKSRTDMISDYFINETDIDFFTPIAPLLKAKNKATVYSQNYDNGHWNNYGAFIGYLELMQRVQNYFPNIKTFSWSDFDITTYHRESKVYDTIPFFETDYNFNLKTPRLAKRTFGVIDNLNLSTTNMAATYKNSNEKLPRALIFGDSYLYEFLTPNLAESFSETVFIHTDNINKLQNLVYLFKPDIVIYENVERSFENTMNILSESTEFIDYSIYKNLPTKNAENLMWVDYINNDLVPEPGVLSIDKTSKTTTISGWAADILSSDVASNVFLRVGDKFYSGLYGMARTSVSEYFNNPNLTNSGFMFSVNSEELKKVDKISFVIISKDKTYQYEPVEYNVVVK